VGGITFTYPGCSGGPEGAGLSTLEEDTIVDAEYDETEKKMKIPYTASNDDSGGPYGLAGVNIMWYFSCG